MRRKEIPGEAEAPEQVPASIADDKSPPDEIVKVTLEKKPDSRGWELTEKGWVYHG